MHVDSGVKQDDYVSHLQRTWYFLRPGETEPPSAVQRGYRTLVDAIRAAFQALRPGIKGGDVDRGQEI